MLVAPEIFLYLHLDYLYKISMIREKNQPTVQHLEKSYVLLQRIKIPKLAQFNNLDHLSTYAYN